MTIISLSLGNIFTYILAQRLSSINHMMLLESISNNGPK